MGNTKADLMTQGFRCRALDPEPIEQTVRSPSSAPGIHRGHHLSSNIAKNPVLRTEFGLPKLAPVHTPC